MGTKEKVKYDKLLESKKKLKTLEQEYKQNEQIYKDLQERNRKIEHELIGLRNKIRQLEVPSKSDGLLITDHAVLRYIERKYSMPIEDVKKEIRDLLDSYNLGDSDNIGGFVIRGNSVLTYTS